MKTLSPEKEALLRAKIAQLESTGDYQTLIRQTKGQHNLVELNLPQAVAIKARQKFQFLEWGRGTGKTTMIGYRISEIVKTMPRSTGLLIGPSYQFILTRIVPSLIQGLEMFGMYENLHYFIGERPPRAWRNSWGKAYQPPKKYDRYITFYNGVGIHLISHDVPGDGRGLNSDWIVGDEAALLDPKKLQENTNPTMRGTRDDAFEGLFHYGYRLYTSSTPITPEGRWMYDFEDKAREKPSKILYLKATCVHNLHNLRKGYLEEAQQDAYQYWIYLAEYEAIRPTFTKDSFYPLFDPDTHCYREDTVNNSHYVTTSSSVDCRGDADLVKGIPLILGVDWGAAINCLVVNQHLVTINEMRTLKSMYVLGDNQKIQDDLFDQFHDYYQYHNNKTVYLWYDNTGNNQTGHTRMTRAQQAAAQLTNKGWDVRLMTLGGTNPHHEDKYLLITQLHKEQFPNQPKHRMNFYQTKELQASMGNAKTKQGRNGEVKKDKSSEKNRSISRQYATDLSDALDTVLFGMFRHLLRRNNTPIPSPRSYSR